MFLSVLLGVVGVFVLQSAIEFHLEVDDAYRYLSTRNELRQAMNTGLTVDTLTPDEYYQSRIGTIGFRYGIAGLFLTCSVAILGIQGQRNLSRSGEGRVV